MDIDKLFTKDKSCKGHHIVEWFIITAYEAVKAIEVQEKLSHLA